MSKILTDNEFNEMMKHPDRTNWARVLECFECTQEQIRKAHQHFSTLAWLRASAQKCITEDFVREFADKIDWFDLPYKSFSINFIREMTDYVDWGVCVCRKYKEEQFKKEYRKTIESVEKIYGTIEPADN